MVYPELDKIKVFVPRLPNYSQEILKRGTKPIAKSLPFFYNGIDNSREFVVFPKDGEAREFHAIDHYRG
jgi:hypothetical protein